MSHMARMLLEVKQHIQQAYPFWNLTQVGARTAQPLVGNSTMAVWSEAACIKGIDFNLSRGLLKRLLPFKLLDKLALPVNTSHQLVPAEQHSDT